MSAVEDLRRRWWPDGGWREVAVWAVALLLGVWLVVASVVVMMGVGVLQLVDLEAVLTDAQFRALGWAWAVGLVSVYVLDQWAEDFDVDESEYGDLAVATGVTAYIGASLAVGYLVPGYGLGVSSMLSDPGATAMLWAWGIGAATSFVGIPVGKDFIEDVEEGLLGGDGDDDGGAGEVAPDAEPDPEPDAEVSD